MQIPGEREVQRENTSDVMDQDGSVEELLSNLRIDQDMLPTISECSDRDSHWQLKRDRLTGVHLRQTRAICMGGVYQVESDRCEVNPCRSGTAMKLMRQSSAAKLRHGRKLTIQQYINQQLAGKLLCGEWQTMLQLDHLIINEMCSKEGAYHDPNSLQLRSLVNRRNIRPEDLADGTDLLVRLGSTL